MSNIDFENTPMDSNEKHFEFINGVCYLDYEFKNRVISRLKYEHANFSHAIKKNDHNYDTYKELLDDVESVIEIFNKMQEFRRDYHG